MFAYPTLAQCDPLPGPPTKLEHLVSDNPFGDGLERACACTSQVSVSNCVAFWRAGSHVYPSETHVRMREPYSRCPAEVGN